MRETQEQIDTMLNTAGESLNFSGGIIKGIPSQQVYNIQSLSSPYDITKQEVSFVISQKDFVAQGIVEGTEFTYVLLTKTYTFKVISFLPDFLGWIDLNVYIKGVV